MMIAMRMKVTNRSVTLNPVSKKAGFTASCSLFYRSVFVAAWCCISLCGNAQRTIPGSWSEFNNYVRSQKLGEYFNNQLTYKDISGSPYFSGEFTEGEIHKNDSVHFKGVWIRLDLFSNKLEFRDQKDVIQELLEPGQYDRFIIGNSAFRYITRTEGNKAVNEFMQILADGNVKLYKKFRINLQEATKPQAYQDAQPPKFVNMSPEYFLVVNNGEAQRIKNQKHVIELLKTQKPALENFVKKEKLNLNKEEELIKAVEYCNQ